MADKPKVNKNVAKPGDIVDPVTSSIDRIGENMGARFGISVFSPKTAFDLSSRASGDPSTAPLQHPKAAAGSNTPYARTGIIESVSLSTDWQRMEEDFARRQVVNKLWESDRAQGGFD